MVAKMATGAQGYLWAGSSHNHSGLRGLSVQDPTAPRKGPQVWELGTSLLLPPLAPLLKARAS